MQKKVYVKDLTSDEIIKRLENSEKLFLDNYNHYLKAKHNTCCEFDENDKVVYINRGFFTNDEDSYFLDEVEDTEADKSCIGKLCKFWDNDYEKAVYSVLDEIGDYDERIYKYVTLERTSFEHCRPLTKEEVLALIVDNDSEDCK